MVIIMIVLRMLRPWPGGEKKGSEGSRPLAAGTAGDSATSPRPDHPGDTSHTSYQQHGLFVEVLPWLPHSTSPPVRRCSRMIVPRISPQAMPNGTWCIHTPAPLPLGKKTLRCILFTGSQSSPAESSFLPIVRIGLVGRPFLANFLPFFTSPFHFQVFPVSLPKETTGTQILFRGSASEKPKSRAPFHSKEMFLLMVPIHE